MYHTLIYLHKIRFTTKFFLFLSKWTLGIYIYHFVVLYGMMEWFNKTLGFLNNSLIIYHIIIALFAIIVSILFLKTIALYYPLSKYALGYK